MKANKLVLSGALVVGALGSVFVASGCQTHVAGMTLPSGHYLDWLTRLRPEPGNRSAMPNRQTG